MHELNKKLAQDFYTYFKKGDAESMVACYHDRIDFFDPVFGNLHGEEACQMWRMLIARGGSDLQIDFEILEANEFDVTVQWQARYVFSQTGRPVHNIIRATLMIESGRIIEHIDQFSIWRWTRMALGIPGYLFGWTPFLRSAIRRKVRRQLQKFSASQAVKNQDQA